MEAKHTATPWKEPVRSGSGNYFIYAEGREQPICGVSFHDDGGANAEFIVRACNSHDALVSALRNLYEAIDSCVDLTPEVLQQASAALSLAKGE